MALKVTRPTHFRREQKEGGTGATTTVAQVVPLQFINNIAQTSTARSVSGLVTARGPPEAQSAAESELLSRYCHAVRSTFARYYKIATLYTGKEDESRRRILLPLPALQ